MNPEPGCGIRACDGPKRGIGLARMEFISSYIKVHRWRSSTRTGYG